MASLAASTAAASIGVSEMLGNFSVASRPAPSASSPVTFKTVALFGKKKAAPPPKKAVAVTPASDELAKWYGKCLHDSFVLLLHSNPQTIGSQDKRDVPYVTMLENSLILFRFFHTSLPIENVTFRTRKKNFLT